jgi:molybdopterin converting factor small subunit
MPNIKIPSPLRYYTGGQAEVQVQGADVGAALDDFIARFPELRQHLFNGKGELRPFVNLFLNSEDVRHLQGLATPLQPDDRLMIVPSVAGGLERVDHSALRTNQAVIILLSLLAFVLNLPWLAALVALAMGVGTVLGQPGFAFVYRLALRPLGLVKPDLLEDNPEPHRFAQGLGAAVLFAGFLSLLAGASALGWALVWLVIALAALNLFVGFCAGCAVYYWLARLQVPGFDREAPQGRLPGMRPRQRTGDGR